jgi:Response regulator containing CheY-like receiver, AAA-type ATPase, and DNA-binding domains
MSYFDFDALHSEDKKMHEIKQLALQLAPTQASILVQGEAGTGKTSLARYVHTKSRAARLYVVECKTTQFLDLSKISSGTLIVEDIDCASAALQADLLSLFARTDGERPRMISTSRRDLRAMVKQEQFRQDLFYKIAVINLEMPRLESRTLDFTGIVNFVLEVSQIIHGKSGLVISAEAYERLRAWNWPGNIRELENVIERAVVLARTSMLGSECIQFEALTNEDLGDFVPGMSLSEVEKRLILQTLELTAQNRTRAAQMLGISIRTLRNKLNEYKEESLV